MKLILAAATATLIGFAAYAAGPVVPPANDPSTIPSVVPGLPMSSGIATDAAPSAVTVPASVLPSSSCADLIAKARSMLMPGDATKAKLASDEIAAADAAGDDATCRTHAQKALGALGGM